MTAGAEFKLWVGVAVAALLAGITAMYRTGRDQLLPAQRVRAAPWGGEWCLCCFLILFLPKEIIIGFLPENPTLDVKLIASMAPLPLQWLLLSYLTRRLYGVSWPFGRFHYRDLVTGFATWLVFGSLTLVLHLVVRWVWTLAGGEATSSHELVQKLISGATSAQSWGLIALEAIVCAPIREELFFRGVFQPWAVRQPNGHRITVLLAVLACLALQGPSAVYQPLLFVIVSVGGFIWLEPGFGTWRQQFSDWSQRLAPALGDRVLRTTVPRAIAATALLFGLFHVASWPDPIPLTFLGLGLGWIAWRCQGIGAAIVCHACFNATTVLHLRLINLLEALKVSP